MTLTLDDSLKRLYRAFQQWAPIPEMEWWEFAAYCKLKTVRKGEHPLRAGEPVSDVYYCVRGLFRLYYVREDGSEYIKSFCAEGELLTSYSALLRSGPAPFSIEALEDAVLLSWPGGLIERLCERHVCWERLLRRCVETLYVKKEDRERQLLLDDAEARYRSFLDVNQGMEDRIPQYHIAAYLGINPVSLSRLRRKLRQSDH